MGLHYLFKLWPVFPYFSPFLALFLSESFIVLVFLYIFSSFLYTVILYRCPYFLCSFPFVLACLQKYVCFLSR